MYFEEKISPPPPTSGPSSTVKPNERPSPASSVTSPAARCPKRKLSPTTTTAECSASTSTSCTNASGLSSENSRVNGTTQSASAPSCSISSALRTGSVSTAGWEPGRTTSDGCGSNVITTDCRPRSWARFTVWPMIDWCPRCTPSKTPIVTTERPQPPGTASYPRHRCMLPPSLLPQRIGRKTRPERYDWDRYARQLEHPGPAHRGVHLRGAVPAGVPRLPTPPGPVAAQRHAGVPSQRRAVLRGRGEPAGARSDAEMDPGRRSDAPAGAAVPDRPPGGAAAPRPGLAGPGRSGRIPAGGGLPAGGRSAAATG